MYRINSNVQAKQVGLWVKHQTCAHNQGVTNQESTVCCQNGYEQVIWILILIDFSLSALPLFSFQWKFAWAVPDTRCCSNSETKRWRTFCSSASLLPLNSQPGKLFCIEIRTALDVLRILVQLETCRMSLARRLTRPTWMQWTERWVRESTHLRQVWESVFEWLRDFWSLFSSTRCPSTAAVRFSAST
jgi:hypothetical protein